MNLRPRAGILFVFSGPSGVGKDTVLEEFLAGPTGVTRCVTATTRAVRPGEVHGRDYLFFSTAEFERLRDRGGFLEWAVVHGNLYGTPVASVDALLQAGDDVVLKIDVQGGRSVRERRPDAVSIFLLPPSAGELETRLRSRGTDGEAEIQRRLADSRRELAERHAYDYWIVNDRVADAAGRLAAIVTAERARAHRLEESLGFE